MSSASPAADQRLPQPGDIVFFSKPVGGGILEVPAIILLVKAGGKADSRVDLKTFETSGDMELRRDVAFATAPRAGYWRWRRDR